MYIVQFIRKDNQVNEEYLYRQYEQAQKHFMLFDDDDSDLYIKINLIEEDEKGERVLDCKFYI